MRTYAVAFGEAECSLGASPKSSFVACSRRQSRREQATSIDSWKGFAPPNLPLAWFLCENTCIYRHKLFTNYIYPAATLLTHVLEYAHRNAIRVSARIPPL